MWRWRKPSSWLSLPDAPLRSGWNALLSPGQQISARLHKLRWKGLVGTQIGGRRRSPCSVPTAVPFDHPLLAATAEAEDEPWLRLGRRLWRRLDAMRQRGFVTSAASLPRHDDDACPTDTAGDARSLASAPSAPRA